MQMLCKKRTILRTKSSIFAVVGVYYGEEAEKRRTRKFSAWLTCGYCAESAHYHQIASMTGTRWLGNRSRNPRSFPRLIRPPLFEGYGDHAILVSTHTLSRAGRDLTSTHMSSIPGS